MKSFFKIPISKKIFIFAILARFLVMPFLYHPDIKIYNFQSSFLSKGVLNIYNFMADKKWELPYREEFVYQPLTYLFWGSYQIISKPLLGDGFNNWLWDASQQSIERPGVFRYIFILKFPLFLFDILMAFLLASFFEQKERKARIFSLWLLNPFSIFIIYGYSGFDIIVSFFVVLALLLTKKEKLSLAVLFLALGALFKAYPVLFLPLVILRSKKALDFFKYIFIFSLTIILVSLPFLSVSFINGAFASGLMTRILSPAIDLGFGVKIIVPIVALSFVYLLSLYDKNRLDLYFFLTSALIISSIHFHIQWLIWAVPFLFIVWVSENKDFLFLTLWFILSFILPFLYDDKQMTVSLFSLFSRYFSFLPHPFILVQKFYDPFYLQSIIQTLSFSLVLFLIWKNTYYIKK
jgi:hypothetical protein